MLTPGDGESTAARAAAPRTLPAPRDPRTSSGETCSGARLAALGAMTGEETFHPDTRALLAYGRALAGSGDAPARQPGHKADKLAERLFVLDRFADTRLVVRTFGAELVTLFGADLREGDFAALWPASDRALLDAFVVAVGAAGQPGIVRADATSTAGARFGAEILLTPLRVPSPAADRYLGLFQPLGGEAFADGALIALRLGALYPPEARLPPRAPRLVVSNS